VTSIGREPEHLIKIDTQIVLLKDGAMAMGKRGGDQGNLFVSYRQLRSAGHPYYSAVNRLLEEKGFDSYAEGLCAQFYALKQGRPGLAPGVYFRCLLVGYFEGIDSERGIAWRVADSMSLREFLGVPAAKRTPDHSTISRTRRLIDLETHREVFSWVLGILDGAGLVVGKTIGVDGTTLEANAAMRSIVRRDDGRSYDEYLTDLAKASGVETPVRDDLKRVDKKRKKKGSNKDWVNPNDPDAQITKMKDGRTHLAHKQEHAVDMDTGAIVAVTIHGGAEGDTSSLEPTLDAADENLDDAREHSGDESQQADAPAEVVTDKGYHSKQVLLDLAEVGWRSYVSEPDRGRQRWEGQRAEQDAVYANRRRIKGNRGRRLMRRRGELVERSFAHTLETGGMRRTHLRRRDNIAKRALIHVAGFNIGLLMRKMFGVGKPRCLQGKRALRRALLALYMVLTALSWLRATTATRYSRATATVRRTGRPLTFTPLATGC
jgi:transposase